MAPCLPCYVFCAMLNTTIIVRGGPKALEPACNSTELQLKTNSTQFAWRQVNSTQLNSTRQLNSATQLAETHLNFVYVASVVVGLLFGCCSQSENGFQSAWQLPRTLTVCVHCKLSMCTVHCAIAAN